MENNPPPVTPLVNPTPINAGTESDKSEIVALTLVFIPIIGTILMWKWMKKWKTWIKILLSVPVIMALLGFFGGLTIMMMTKKSGVYEKIRQNSPSSYQTPSTSNPNQ